MAESITILIGSFELIHKELIETQKLDFNYRSASTNDVENYFSTLKRILGRDGRGLRMASSIEVAHALKKCSFITLEKLNLHRGYEIPSSKRTCYEDNVVKNVSRHQKEGRDVPKNPLSRAKVGVDQVNSIRNFYK